MVRGTTCLSGCVSATAVIAAIVFPGAALAAPGGNGPDGTGAPGNPHAPGATGNPHAPGATGNPHQGEPPYGVAKGHSKAQTGNTGGNGGGGSPASTPNRGSGNGPRPASGGGSGGGTPNGPPGKTTICHHTHSETNPYVEITVANPAVENGHSRHGDLIPAPSGGCEGGVAQSSPLESANAALNPAPNPASAPGAGPVPRGVATSGPDGSSTSTFGGGGGGALGAGDPVAGEPADPNASGGSLPFTGLALGTLFSVALMLLFGGWLIRRFGLREEPR